MSATALIIPAVGRGESWKPIAHLTNTLGIDLDLSACTVVLQMKPVAGGTIVKRTKGVAGEATFPYAGSNARIQFLFAPAQTLSQLVNGDYDVEVVYGDVSADPDDLIVAARGRVNVYTPATDPIAP